MTGLHAVVEEALGGLRDQKVALVVVLVVVRKEPEVLEAPELLVAQLRPALEFPTGAFGGGVTAT